MNESRYQRIRVEVLSGSLRVVLGQHVITHFRSRKHAALLAYLACHSPGRRHSRATIADLLWPDSAPASAKASLCEAISSLRTQIEPAGVARGSIILADRATIALSVDVETDFETLSNLLLRAKQAELRSDAALAIDLRLRATSLFRDCLLPELGESWLFEVQAHLSARIAEAECVLAAHFLRSGNNRTATNHARRAFALDESCSAFSPDLEVLIAASDAALTQTDVSTRGRRPNACGTARPHSLRDRRKIERRRSARQSVAARTPIAPPPLLPLFAPSTRFFGRDGERARLATLLSDPDVRLITLAGPGGIGKTRLALAVSHDFARADPKATVWFVQMSAVSDEARMCDHLLRAVAGNGHTGAAGGTDTLSCRAALSRILRSARGRVLLVLDNLEQIAESAGELITYLLSQVPNLRCLATSRQRLLRQGEHWVPVDPLPTPPPDYQIVAADLDEFVRSWPSVALFVDRARQSAPNFRLTVASASAIAALVAELEGIPLAIELAAARALLFTPRQMLAEVNRNRFALLVDRQAQRRADAAIASEARIGAEARQSSLNAAIAWSYNLLAPEAQALLASLAVFSDGCTLAAVQFVLASESESPSVDDLRAARPESVSAASATGDLLEQLCHGSFLQVDRSTDDSDKVRFVMLETIREFAEAKLSAEQAAVLAARHAAYFAGLAATAESHLQAADASHWMTTLDRDYANLSSALDWAARTPTPEAGRCSLVTATALHRYWLIRSSLREGRERLKEALAHPGADAEDHAAQATARNRAGVLAMTDGDDDAAEARYREALALHQALNDRAGMASVLNNLAILAGSQGQALKARALYMEALTIWRSLGDIRLSAVALSNLGTIDNESENLESALAFLNESVPMAQSVGDTRGAAISLRNLGIVAYKLRRMEMADKRFRESLAPLRALGDERGCAYSLLGLGLTAYRQGQQKRARRLLETALSGYAAFGLPLTPFARAEIDRLAAAGFRIDTPILPPGSAAASGAVHAVSVVTQVLLDDWEDAATANGANDLVLYTHTGAYGPNRAAL